MTFEHSEGRCETRNILGHLVFVELLTKFPASAVPVNVHKASRRLYLHFADKDCSSEGLRD